MTLLLKYEFYLSDFSAALTTKPGTGIDTGAALRALTQSQWGTTIIAEFTFP